MTLGNTENDLKVDHGQTRMCRDFDVVSEWIYLKACDYSHYLGEHDE